MLTLQFWNSSFVPVYSELVPPGLAIEDVVADHSLAVQLLAKWLERLNQMIPNNPMCTDNMVCKLINPGSYCLCAYLQPVECMVSLCI